MVTIENGGALESAPADILIVGVFEDLTWGPGAAPLVEAQPNLESYFAASGFTGSLGAVTIVPAPSAADYPALMFVGLGADLDLEGLRTACGSAARAAAKFPSVATTLHQVDLDGGVDAAAFGFASGLYSFTEFKSEGVPNATESIVFLGDVPGAREAIARGVAMAAGVALARDLVNAPAGTKPPEVLAARATELAHSAGMEIEVFDRQQIVEAGFGGLAAVGAAASNPPRMVVLKRQVGAARTLALVGKGVVFDSGGLSIKSVSGMETMKTDMAGAATVLAAAQVIAELDIAVNLLVVAPLTENVISGDALKPGDVFTARNGKTVEVLNTDAEGRLILADGLSLAAEFEPDLVIDVATLTGAAKVALGADVAAVFGTEDARSLVVDAAATAGEKVWPMPLVPAYRKLLDSDIADLKNTGDRWGGAITAALFLQEFAGDGPWAHIDIAGPARSRDVSGYGSKGATGFGVRTVVAAAEQLAAELDPPNDPGAEAS